MAVSIGLYPARAGFTPGQKIGSLLPIDRQSISGFTQPPPAHWVHDCSESPAMDARLAANLQNPRDALHIRFLHRGPLCPGRLPFPRHVRAAPLHARLGHRRLPRLPHRLSLRPLVGGPHPLGRPRQLLPHPRPPVIHVTLRALPGNPRTPAKHHPPADCFRLRPPLPPARPEPLPRTQ